MPKQSEDLKNIIIQFIENNTGDSQFVLEELLVENLEQVIDYLEQDELFEMYEDNEEALARILEVIETIKEYASKTNQNFPGIAIPESFRRNFLKNKELTPLLSSFNLKRKLPTWINNIPYKLNDEQKKELKSSIKEEKLPDDNEVLTNLFIASTLCGSLTHLLEELKCSYTETTNPIFILSNNGDIQMELDGQTCFDGNLIVQLSHNMDTLLNQTEVLLKWLFAQIKVSRETLEDYLMVKKLIKITNNSIQIEL